jgi:hypothetical protein
MELSQSITHTRRHATSAVGYSSLRGILQKPAEESINSPILVIPVVVKLESMLVEQIQGERKVLLVQFDKPLVQPD